MSEAWADEAIRSVEDDTLGRRSYAKHAAALITGTHSFDSSIVFGLSGPWGSGKTSVVNMIIEAIDEADTGWAIARFTPWAASDLTGLLGDFYSSLAESIPKKRRKKVRRALAVTASVAAPAATMIPVAGAAVSEGVKLAGAALAKTPSWEAAFAQASKELKELKQPILVVVDDIDRLHADELMTLLKVVRLLGRFDGVQYLLAYDDETLYRTMASSSSVTTHDGSAERFMEKIVQYPLFVPPMLRHQQITRLRTGLSEISRMAIDEDVSDRRISRLMDCFLALLTTPRAIDRYLAQLQHHLPLLPEDEVDDDDVSILTLIRVSFPALFAAIPSYRDQLIQGHTGEWKRGTKIEWERFELKPLLKLVPAQRRTVAKRLLISLFPKVRDENQIGTDSSRRRQSVQHEEYFDRYFAMTILDQDISDSAVRSALASAADGNGTDLARLLLDEGESIRSLVLSKSRDAGDFLVANDRRLRLAKFLVSVAAGLPQDNRAPFSDLDQVLAWIAYLLVGLDANASTADIENVLDRLPDNALKIQTWKLVQSGLRDDSSGKHKPWCAPVTAHLVEHTMDDVLQHLKLGDAAPSEAAVAYQIQFVLAHEPEELRAAVRGLLATQQISLDTLASRLVSARSPLGGKPSWTLSSDFNQETFNRVAPSGDDPWYSQPRQDVDVHDLSWRNRRLFAAGRVSPPPTGKPDEVRVGTSA